MAARGQPFAEIATASPEMLGMLMLKGDLHAARLDDHAQHAAVLDALADGMTTAAELRRRFPLMSPRRIAGELRIKLGTTDDDPLVGTIWRFAEHRPRPPQILLYARGLTPLEQ